MGAGGESEQRCPVAVGNIIPESHRTGHYAPIPSMQKGSPGKVKIKLPATHTPTVYAAVLVFKPCSLSLSLSVFS